MVFSDKYYESEEFRTILQRYEEAVAQGRSPYLEPDELADIAEYYEMLGNAVAAADVLDYGLSIFPGSAVLLALRARLALVRDGDVDKARRYVSLIEDTTTLDYYYIRAEIMLTEGNADEADSYLSEILDTLYDDEREDFIIDITGIFADYQQWEKAAKWLQLSSDVNAADYKELCGRIAMNRGNYEESERIFNELIDSDPYSTPYWNHLASAQYMHHNIRDSIQSSEFSIAINPDDTEAILNKANGLFCLGNFEEAGSFYQRYADLCPDDEAGELFHGICCLNLEQTDEGIEHLRRAEAIALSHRSVTSEQRSAPSNLQDIWQELAFALSQKGMTDEALSYIDKMKTEPGVDPYELLVMRGHLLMEGGRLEEGQACYMKAISQSSGAPQVFLRIAISIYDLGYYQQSYQMFQILHDCTDDTRTDGYAYEALCCYALGRYDEFKENVRLACEKNPTEAQMALAEFFPPELAPQDYYKWLEEQKAP